MMINMLERTFGAALVAALALAAVSQPAHASTMTWNFSQTGWVDKGGNAGTLSGVFQGTPEANGSVQLGDLTYFAATLVSVKQTFNFADVGTFFFSAGSPSSLAFLAKDTLGNEVCSGAGPTGPCASLGITGDVTGYLLAKDPISTSSTTNLSVSVQEMLPGPVPAPQPAAAPEPSSMLLAGSALVAAALLGRKFRRLRAE